jgi:hypothetical protein
LPSAGTWMLLTILMPVVLLAFNLITSMDASLENGRRSGTCRDVLALNNKAPRADCELLPERISLRSIGLKEPSASIAENRAGSDEFQRAHHEETPGPCNAGSNARARGVSRRRHSNALKTRIDASARMALTA